MQYVAFRLSLICWGTFYIFWLVSAALTKRTSSKESFIGSIGYRIPAVIAFIFLFNGKDFPEPLRNILLASGDAVAIIASFCSIAGLIVCIWARVTLGRNWSSIVVVKVEHELIQNGPYRYVRHPIYTGMLLLFLANVLLSGRISGFVGFILLAASFVIKLLREEKVMLKVFPQAYPEYMRRVKRLIPYLV